MVESFCIASDRNWPGPFNEAPEAGWVFNEGEAGWDLSMRQKLGGVFNEGEAGRDLSMRLHPSCIFIADRRSDREVQQAQKSASGCSDCGAHPRGRR